MKTFFRFAALSPLLGLLAGCCANNANTCDDLLADSLYLVLKDKADASIPGDMSYFTQEELDTVYLQRYAPAMPANPTATPPTKAQPAGALSDPVVIVRAQQTRASLNSALARKLAAANLLPTTIVISNNTPFPTSTTGGKLSAYNYVLTVQDRSTKIRQAYVFTLKNITLQGRYDADGCTTCYENTLKTVLRQGPNSPKTDSTLTVTETQTKNGVKVPVRILITKLD